MIQHIRTPRPERVSNLTAVNIVVVSHGVINYMSKMPEFY